MVIVISIILKVQAIACMEIAVVVSLCSTSGSTLLDSNFQTHVRHVQNKISSPV